MEQVCANPNSLKAALRTHLRECLCGLTPAGRMQASEAICRRVEKLPVWQQARLLALFVPQPSEVDVMLLTPALARAGKQVLLPRYHAATESYDMIAVDPALLVPGQAPWRLVPGRFGIYEPAAALAPMAATVLAGADVVWLVPGLAFDPAGGRLGRGGGYYDRLLAGRRGAKIGVAFACQLVPEVPMGPRDIRLDWVVTDREVVTTAGRSLT